MRTHVTALLLLLAAAGPGLLPPGAAASRERNHDEVRRAVERGEIKPLASILEAVRARLPGEVTSVEVEQKKGRWVYEFRTLDSNGRVLEVYVDAHTAEIIRIKEK